MTLREENEMLKKNIIAGILVRNFDEALDFYTKKLGFVVVEDFSMGTDRWLTITAPGNQDCVLALHEARNEAEQALVGKQMGSYPFLGIDTDDCVGDYERMKALGVKFDGEPSVKHYGIGVMLEDLYGNKIYLNEEPAGAAASA
jgi:catechol 2,3-dioxygenase-like lactoylglutathione lyase family enzyme